MRVNVDDVAFMDRRFKLLAGRLGMARQEALGRCLPVWALRTSGAPPSSRPADVDALAELEAGGSSTRWWRSTWPWSRTAGALTRGDR